MNRQVRLELLGRQRVEHLDLFLSPLAEHRYWPMLVGILVTVAVTALLSFPLIPGFLGWLVNVAVILLGLGAFWLWGLERTARKPPSAA